MNKGNRDSRTAQAQAVRSALLADHCYHFLRPLLTALDRRLDRRLVETFLGTVLAILIHRHRNHGLVLSELGGYLLSPAQAPAGTKRLQHLLGAPSWSAQDTDEFLGSQADQRVAELETAGETALAVWDESGLEKPESQSLEGLGPVRSTKAARLTRIKPGYFRPPGGPVFVPGMHWLTVLVLGRSGPPVLAALRWWTGRGPRASNRQTEVLALLGTQVPGWGRRVVHLFDRGFASGAWLGELLTRQARFVLRWPARYQLFDLAGRLRPAWQIARGQRSWEHRQLWDARRRCWRRAGVLALPVRHPEYPHPLWLVVSRFGKGRTPWYLLTAEPILSPQDAWRVVLAYARRWQVEMTVRFQKSELAFESPRLQAWDRRCKLLGIATLAYAFLLSLLHPDGESLCRWLLAHGCHRTGTWQAQVKVPLYRLRSALSRLWLAHPPPFLLRLSSG